MTTTGDIVIFDSGWVVIDRFSEKLLKCKDDDTGKYGFRNTSGEWEIEPRFNFAGSFSEGLAAVTIDDKDGEEISGFINHTGAFELPPVYHEAGTKFKEGLAPVVQHIDVTRKPGYINRGAWKWGYINRSGNLDIPYRFGTADFFSEGLAAVKNDKKKGWGFINKMGEFVIEPQFHSVRRPFVNGIAFVIIKENNQLKRAYINTCGEIISNFIIE